MATMNADGDDDISEVTPLVTHRSPAINDRHGPYSPGDGHLKMMTLATVIVCFFCFYLVPVLELNPYLYDMISKDYPKMNMSAQTPCVRNMYNTSDHSPERKIQEEIEKRVSTMEMYLGLTSRLLAIIPILALGPLTDRYGRKIGFIVPVLGTWLKVIVYTLTIWLKWPVKVLYLGHILEATGGSFAAVFVTTFSFVSDVTVPGKQRAVAITVFEALQTLTVAAAEVGYAHWFKVSYLHPLILGCFLGLGTIFLVIFLLPETVLVSDTQSPRQKSGNTRSKLLWRTPILLLKRCVGIYMTGQERRILILRRLCFIVFTMVIAVDISKSGVQNLLLMKYPLCWPNSKVYVYSGVSLMVNWGVIGLLMPVFQKLLDMNGRHIAIVGIVSGIVMTSFMAFARNDAMVYEATAVGVLTRVTIPVIRSVMSSLVGGADQGSMYASFGCIETFGASVFATIANRIYYATLEHFAGAIFIIFACTYFLALVFVVILNVLSKDKRTGREDNPD